MPTNKKKYRLREFILTERSDDYLTWTTHIAFGYQRSGKCKVAGNILLFLPWDGEEPGYLKLEFHLNLMRLPPWDTTAYYCFSQNLRQVDHEHSLADKIKPETAGLAAPSSFRIGRTKISVDANNRIFWQAINETNKTMGGTCHIESEILFLDSKEIELDEGQSRLFYKNLKMLPIWTRTLAWGHQESLLICHETKSQITLEAPCSRVNRNNQP